MNGSTFVAADDADVDDDDSFPDPTDIEDDPLATTPAAPSSFVPLSDPVQTTAAALAPSPPPTPVPTSVPSSTPAPAAPSEIPKPLSTTLPGILKPGTPSADCVVIADLYKATGPWRFVPDTVNCCNAEYPNSAGIKCNTNGQIIYIYLAGQGLTGPLPESLGSLAGLPSSAAGWVNMGTLNLQQNALTGPLPNWLTTLPNLHSLALGQNLFNTEDAPNAFTFNLEPVVSGSNTSSSSVIPLSANPANYTPPTSTFLESFTRLPKLKQLKIDSLAVSGGFPASWQLKMVNLTKLDISNNSMQGPIPGFINGFTGLKTLLLDRNEFGGPIPSLEFLRSLSVRPAVNTTLPGIRVHQTHNGGGIRPLPKGLTVGWATLGAVIWLLLTRQ
ncbi:hypothetical protein BGZ58_009899 [Dissophora ornata]|nr:hypothetical protein BGZ58_009899 [Dissophora ornata]